MPTTTGIFTAEEARFENYPFSESVAENVAVLFAKDHPVIDIGCGPGLYLNFLCNAGFSLLRGVDGQLNAVHPKVWSNMDIMLTSLDLTTNDALYFLQSRREKGNVLCLEVGEHIPEEFESHFIELITCICDRFLVLSWAIPGQNGIGHVNCKENADVIKLIEARGFRLDKDETDWFRSDIENHVRYFRDTIMVFEKIN